MALTSKPSISSMSSYATFEEGLKHLEDYAKGGDKGNAFSILVRLDDGTYEAHDRWSQPCYGEMRPYGSTHGDILPESQREVRKPSDLFCPFPDGTPVAVSVPLRKPEIYGDLYLPFLDKETSPWRKVLQDAEVYTDEEGTKAVGILIPNADFDPTVLVNLLMNFKSICYRSRDSHPIITWMKEGGLDILEAYIASEVVNFVSDYRTKAINAFQVSLGGGYHLNTNFDLYKFINGEPDDLTGGTLAQRYAYNRPAIQDIFGKEGVFRNKVATLVASLGNKPDFKKVAELIRSEILGER